MRSGAGPAGTAISPSSRLPMPNPASSAGRLAAGAEGLDRATELLPDTVPKVPPPGSGGCCGRDSPIPRLPPLGQQGADDVNGVTDDPTANDKYKSINNICNTPFSLGGMGSRKARPAIPASDSLPATLRHFHTNAFQSEFHRSFRGFGTGLRMRCISRLTEVSVLNALTCVGEQVSPLFQKGRADEVTRVYQIRSRTAQDLSVLIQVTAGCK
jgi:hypothetical protein